MHCEKRDNNNNNNNNNNNDLKRKQNHLFVTNQQALYKTFGANKSTHQTITPNASEAPAFWNLYGHKGNITMCQLLG